MNDEVSVVGKIFYGTQTGTSEGIALAIQAALPDLITDVRCVFSVKDKAEIQDSDFLILGGSTWGDGELTDDWVDFLPQFETLDFTGKKVALFALGDQHGYSYNFVSAMKILYDKVIAQGGEIVATDVSKEGFEFDHSEAIVDDKFIGLVVDEVNEPHLTDARIDVWAKQVRLAVTGALV